MSDVGKKFIKNNIQGYVLEDSTLSILLNKKEIEELYFCLIINNPYFIQYINNPTEKIKLEAIKQNGFVIQFIENPTEEMKWIAIKKEGYAIYCIDNPTEEMKEIAIKKMKEIVIKQKNK